MGWRRDGEYFLFDRLGVLCDRHNSQHDGGALMTIRILAGDCRDVLKTLAENSVHCCVTSPPYFGLRDYGTAAWVGGWNTHCEHKKSVWEGPKQTQGAQSGHASKKDRLGRKECIECGAVRVDSQIGLEPTPDEFVAAIVEVFQEVRRVLRGDGTVFLNLGDSYSSGGNGAGHEGSKQRTNPGANLPPKRTPGLGPKQLVGIPWRVAFALQADGWILRQDIIWSKPNPMPESVTDRCTKAHEYVFLLSKSERYYYDQEAIAEPAVAERGPGNKSLMGLTEYLSGSEKHRTKAGLVAYSERQREKRKTPSGTYSEDSGRNDGNRHPSGGYVTENGNRNKRSVWTVATQPYSEAHFATFPPALIEPCILAGCPQGGVVLDPFFGAGTTGLVADRLGREALGIELNPEYIEIARRRIEADGGMFSSVVIAPPATVEAA